MSLQLVEAYIPQKHFTAIDEKIKSFNIVSYWSGEQTAKHTLVRILVKTEDSEDVLEYFESVANLIDGFEVLLMPVQTYLKRKSPSDEGKEKESEGAGKLQRASRHELYLHIESSSKSDLTYILFVVLSAIVVFLGLVKDSSAIVIGGMVIAPLLGPVIAVAFASILGDFKLLRRSSLTMVKGILLALAISILFSLCFTIPETAEFSSRTQVDLSDIVLALASGAAGAISILRRFPSSLVGVMVAVALLPPTVVLGMSIGGALWSQALGAMLLLLVNINSILLAAVVTFSLSGIHPVHYEEIQRADNSKRYSLLFISIIVGLLVLAVVYSKPYLDIVS